MIGTLLTHEYLSTRRSLFTAIGITLLVAAVSLASAALRVPLLGGIGFGVGVVLVLLLTPIALALLAEHYWRTMYGRQGYFTMTLPVRGRTLFTAKILYGLIVSFLALTLTLVGLVGVMITTSLSQGQPPLAALQSALDSAQTSLIWFVAGVLILQLVFSVIAGAAIMSIGAESRFNHLGFGAPVIGGVIVHFAMQILGLAAMLFIPFGLRVAGPDAGSFVAQGMLSEFVASLNGTSQGSEPGTVGLGIVFVTLAAAVLLAWWGGRSVERRTSLR